MEMECEQPEVSLIDTEVTPGTIEEFKERKGTLETYISNFPHDKRGYPCYFSTC